MRAEDILHGAVDYAGLFPPASLGMEEVVRNYASYRSRDDAWALGRLVVPMSRLEELLTIRATVDDPIPWQLSALAGGTPVEDAARALEFNDAHGALAVVDAVEVRASSVDDVRALEPVRRVVEELYVEVPPTSDLPALLRAIAELEARAKIRTGGTTPDAFPDARSILRFLVACRDAGVAFKATAGLHHAVRGEYPLTYEPEAPTGTMYGYLNIILAAALLWRGGGEGEVLAVLEERDATTLRVTDDGVDWGRHAIPADALRGARGAFVSSFGSCSFDEPVQELRHSTAA